MPPGQNEDGRVRDELMLHTDNESPAPTLRDLLAVLFRQKRLAGAVFVFTLAVVLIWGLNRERYEGEMKFLVEKQRIDPVAGPADVQTPFVRTEVTEEELNSEVDILQDRDLLREVVQAADLAHPGTLAKIFPSLAATNSDEQLDTAVKHLQRQMVVESVKRANLVRVAYRSSDRQESLRVLGALMRLYLAKNTEVHRPAGQSRFFDEQAQHYSEALQISEDKMAGYLEQANVVSAATQRDLMLQKLTDFEASQEQNLTTIAEDEHRIRVLKEQMTSTPDRQTTAIKVADNPFLLQQLKSTLMNLTLKRTELLTKFQPSYRLVTEVEQQIAESKAAIAAEELKPVREETTDREPTHTWVEAELAKVEVDLNGLHGRASANQSTITRYRTASLNLGQQAIRQGDLMRTAKIAEDNFVLYNRKKEENRIVDGLDARGILNVMVAESPIVPGTPRLSFLLLAIAAMAVAGTAGAGCAFVADHLDPAFRTPDEVLHELGVTVLASIPRDGSPTRNLPSPY